MHFRDLPVRVAEVRARMAAAAQRGGRDQPVTLVAVTKAHGPDAVRAAWEAGVPDIGENRVQEALAKMGEPDMPDVRWHLIGHVQRNKVKYLHRFSLVHSVDSMRLAEAINASLPPDANEGRRADVLVQVNTSGEASKGGFEPGELDEAADRLNMLDRLRVCGVMTMAPFDANEGELREVFAGARRARELLEGAGHPARELSMGMSNDYEIAIEEGATMVRLGTTLFGARET